MSFVDFFVEFYLKAMVSLTTELLKFKTSFEQV